MYKSSIHGWANEGQHRPTAAHGRPTQAHKGPQHPTTANDGQRRPTKAHSTQQRPMKANAGPSKLKGGVGVKKNGPNGRKTRNLGLRYFFFKKFFFFVLTN